MTTNLDIPFQLIDPSGEVTGAELPKLSDDELR
ncbi:MAG: hypothetical protein ACJAVJ_000426, partial [Planctomycetota bacterium]